MINYWLHGNIKNLDLGTTHTNVGFIGISTTKIQLHIYLYKGKNNPEILVDIIILSVHKKSWNFDILVFDNTLIHMQKDAEILKNSCLKTSIFLQYYYSPNFQNLTLSKWSRLLWQKEYKTWSWNYLI